MGNKRLILRGVSSPSRPPLVLWICSKLTCNDIALERSRGGVKQSTVNTSGSLRHTYWCSFKTTQHGGLTAGYCQIVTSPLQSGGMAPPLDEASIAVGAGGGGGIFPGWIVCLCEVIFHGRGCGGHEVRHRCRPFWKNACSYKTTGQ